MGLLVLCGDICDTFSAVSEPFVDAARRVGTGPITLLLQGGEGWEQYVDRYRRPWQEAAAIDVAPIVPTDGGALDDRSMEVLAGASGIFMGGGHTPTYRSVFVESPAGDVIRKRVAAGVPYGGVSAGAVLAAEHSLVAGSAVLGPLGRFVVRADGGDEELAVAAGLGLLQGLVVEAHFAELGGFPRLVEALARTGAPLGVGIDEPAGVVFEDGHGTVSGRGRVYLVRPSDRHVSVEILYPGDRFAID